MLDDGSYLLLRLEHSNVVDLTNFIRQRDIVLFRNAKAKIDKFFNITLKLKNHLQAFKVIGQANTDFTCDYPEEIIPLARFDLRTSLIRRNLKVRAHILPRGVHYIKVSGGRVERIAVNFSDGSKNFSAMVYEPQVIEHLFGLT